MSLSKVKVKRFGISIRPIYKVSQVEFTTQNSQFREEKNVPPLSQVNLAVISKNAHFLPHHPIIKSIIRQHS